MPSMTRRGFLGCAGGVAAAAALNPAGAANMIKPNIVFILADDLGYGDIGCYGRDDVRTPAIDGLARQGVRFTQSYSSGPECSPTRTAFLTGCYCQRPGGLECAIGSDNVGRYDDAIRLRETNDLGLPPSETSIARLLKGAGYATSLTGKWHLGYEEKFSPMRHGFDTSFYCLGGGMDYFYHVEPEGRHVLRRNGEPIHRDGSYFTDLTTDEAVTFIEGRRAEPFFLYVPFTTPHAPYQGPQDRRPERLPQGDPLWNQSQAPPAVYRAMIENMDQCVGRILGALDANGLAGNTLVFFVSDNGGTKSGRNAPFSNIKGSTFEGGIRVPAIARWPGHIPAGITSDQVCATMDFTASIARAAGARLPAGFRYDGVDVLQWVEKGEPVRPRTLFWRGRRGENTRCGVRDGDLKLIVERRGPNTKEYLFDLATDITEERDLLAARPADAARLRAKLAAWEVDVRPVR